MMSSHTASVVVSFSDTAWLSRPLSALVGFQYCQLSAEIHTAGYYQHLQAIELPVQRAICKAVVLLNGVF